MKDELKRLADASLEASDVPAAYDGDDLVNALLILQHVSFSIAWERFDGMGVQMPTREMLAEEYGKNLRQSITLFTGIDPADAVRGEHWPEIVGEHK